MKEFFGWTAVVTLILSSLMAPLMYPTPLGYWWPWISCSAALLMTVMMVTEWVGDILAARRNALRREIEREMGARSLPVPDIDRL